MITAKIPPINLEPYGFSIAFYSIEVGVTVTPDDDSVGQAEEVDPCFSHYSFKCGTEIAEGVYLPSLNTVNMDSEQKVQWSVYMSNCLMALRAAICEHFNKNQYEILTQIKQEY